MKQIGALALCFTFAISLTGQTPVTLGTAGNFTVLAGSTVTNTGNTVVLGNVGVFPGTAVTGFPPGIVSGGVIHAGDAVAGIAQNDLTAAYVDAAGRAFNPSLLPGDIGGLTLMPGVYRNNSSLGITGTVTLNGNGSSSSVFIIQVGTALTTAPGNSVVNLINGALASNVFWQVGSSATLGTNTVFNGTILAQASITLTTGAVLNGRALARTGAVTLDTNAATNPGPAGAPGALSVSCAFPTGVLNQPYVSALGATGGIPPYTFSISAGNLPTGLNLNTSTGAITGTPTAANTFNYTARVMDSTSASATTSCSINVLATPPALSLMCAPGSGFVGVNYVSALVAAGGAPAYTYSISAGSLPGGLTLNPSTGAITGTPGAVGTFDYTGRVIDSDTTVATATCVIGITAPPPATPAPSSFILVLTAMAFIRLYRSRARRLQDRLSKTG